MNTAISVLDAYQRRNQQWHSSAAGTMRSDLSAGLSGSGMAFDAHWFRQNVAHLQTAGEDKELEALLLQQRIHTDLPGATAHI